MKHSLIFISDCEKHMTAPRYVAESCSFYIKDQVIAGVWKINYLTCGESS